MGPAADLFDGTKRCTCGDKGCAPSSSAFAGPVHVARKRPWLHTVGAGGWAKVRTIAVVWGLASEAPPCVKSCQTGPRNRLVLRRADTLFFWGRVVRGYKNFATLESASKVGPLSL